MTSTHSLPPEQSRPRPGDTRKKRRLARGGIVLGLILLALWVGQKFPHGQEVALPAGLAMEDPAGLPQALTKDAAAAFARMELRDLAGKSVPVGSFQGRPMLLNFWASWCAPCTKELPALDALAQHHPNLQVVTASLDAAPATVSDFLKAHRLTHLVALRDEGGRNFAALKEAGLPLTLLVRADGTVAERLTGYRDWTKADMQEKLAALATK